jgi:ring-1,2-phenylacetyl-CoA epoxidase subunit PaaD
MVSVTATLWEIAASVPDPELPFLTLADLGILREIHSDAERVVVSITPTYSGCPAMREIMQDVQRRVEAVDPRQVEVRTILQPPWTTDWITNEGRRKLVEAGVAAPAAAPRHAGPIPLTLSVPVRRVECPVCGSPETEQTSAFSATACKALYRCTRCREPFEYIKEI